MSLVPRNRTNYSILLNHWSVITLTTNTRKMYEYCILSLIREGLDINNIDSYYLDAFFKDQERQGKTIGSLKNKISALSSFYNYLIKKGKLKINPIKSMVYKISIKPNPIKIKKRAISLNVIEAMFDKMDAETIKEGKEHASVFLIKMLLNTGARISELLSLELYGSRKDNDEYINYVKINNGRSYVYLLGKGNRIREFHLNEKVTAYLLEHPLKEGEKIFRNSNNQPLTRHGAYYLIKRAEKKYLDGVDLYKFSPHSLRHSYITLQVKRNRSPLNIAKTVGNSARMIEKTYLSEAEDINSDFNIL